MTSLDSMTISKSLDNDFTFIIKQQNSTLPMTLDDTDTFTAHLFRLEDNVEDDTVSFNISKESPYEDGKVALSINNTSHLSSERGDKSDRYYLIPTYKLVIECDTVNNGKFLAKINNVYVDV